MKKMLLLLFIIWANNSIAQKTKTTDIVKVGMGGLTVYQLINYNDQGIAFDTSYFLIGRDGRYQQLIEYVTVFSGDIVDLYKFIKYAQSFYNKEEDGVTENKNGHRLSIWKITGQKFAIIYGIGSDNGYIGFNGSMFNKLLSKIESWANENKVSLK